MRKSMAWFAVPAAVALSATWMSAPASAATSPPQIVKVDGGSNDAARTIAVDAAGNAYLGGSISTGPNSQGKYSIVKLNAQGSVLWRANFSGSDGMLGGATSLGVDPAGNVYSAGFIRNDPAVGVLNDTVLAKFSATGQELWSRRVRGGPEYARIAATTDGFIAGGRAVTGEMVTQRFDPNGVMRWSRSLGVPDLGTPFELQRFGDLALAPNGNIVVSHSVNNNGDGFTYDFDTTVYSPLGNPLWRKVFTLDNESHEVVSDIAVDQANRVIVTGTTAIRNNPEFPTFSERGITVRYGADGALLQTVNTGSTAVDIDPAGNAYLAGFTSFGASPTVTKFDTAFNVVYNTSVPTDVFGTFGAVVAAKVDTTGVVTMAGIGLNAEFASDYVTVRFAANGQELGRHRLNGSANMNDVVVGVAIDAQNTALVTGTSRNGTSGDDIVTLRFAGAGAPNPTPTPTPAVSPAAPSNLRAVAASRSQIQLAWSDNSNNETGFQIERCRGLRCTNFTRVATVGAQVTSFTDQGLSRSTTYTYRVRAVNEVGPSGFTNTASATTRR
jgi:hypothetical protein